MVRIPLISRIFGATGESLEASQWKNAVKRLASALKGGEIKTHIYMQDVKKHPLYRDVYYPGEKAQKTDSDLKKLLVKYKVYIK